MKRLKSILSLLLIFAMMWWHQPATFASVSDTGFSDVRSDAWYAEAVIYCVENSLMSGTAANIFSPDAPMSRAMLATVLYRMAGSPQITGSSGFYDVASGAWYTDAVTWAVRNEIVSGYGSGLFGTNDPVTYEQILTILWRYSGNLTVDETTLLSSDEEVVSAYAAGAVNWAQSIGVIVSKTDNHFSPKGNATRAGVAMILHNYLNLEQSAAKPTLIPEPASTPQPAPTSESGMISIHITVGNSIFFAKLYNNSTTRAFLEQFPMTLNMTELNGNEKFYNLPNRLPADSEQIGSIKNGDLMLYGSDCLVLFYKSFSTSYSYTKLGYIEDASGLAATLGSGGAEVTFAISD